MLNDKELALLSQLRHDSRQHLTKVAERTGISKSTLFDILNKLNKEVIIKHVSLIDFAMLGFSIRINFAIKSRLHDQMLDLLYNHPNVNSLYKVVNNYNFFAETIFRNMKDAYEFIDMVEKAGGYEIMDHMVIEELKVEGMYQV